MANIVIGIEGLVGAGKTSICRELIKRIPNTVLLNGGNLYRAIVYAMMQNGSKVEELKKQGKNLDIKEMMDLFKVQIKVENNETIVYIDNEKVDENAIQSKEASMAVSTVGGSADNKNLFIFARGFINELKENYNVIVSGRSVMKIYPDCDYHFFITADLEERVKRKCIQYENKETREEIRENIQKRDELQKQAGFYDFSSITEEVDVTNCKTVEESTDLVLSKMKLPLGI
ncbi:MAG: (d)CMP kinase [Clostridia bacterium]|nr:(d)CMP kinase [Clostridia bacterium]